ncbi:M48 family metalloprotease [candidate division KSB1 bacterium]|nr:M48 family metalloprotease [candidate division KSB1 bacterium]
MKRKLLLALLAIICVPLLWSCARDYVTGKSTFSLMSESQEVALGREADPQILAEYGAYDDAALTAYVSGIGQEIARVCHRPNLEYNFRVVDSPVVNAFALPGGYVYFTRGILAHFNSEDELAGVMGHEIGHVVARHGAEQQTRVQLATLGLGLGSIISEDFQKISGALQTGVSLLFLKYGRSQESESDKLGADYSTRLGYDAHQMAGFFRTIARLSEGSGQQIPTFLSTHPDPGQREVRVGQLASEFQTKGPYTPKKTDRSDYLRRIDGVVYGDDPRKGFVENNMFYHPELRFQFPVPQKWIVVNSAQQVQIINPEKNAGVQMSLGEGKTPAAAADAFISGAQATVLRRENKRVNGMAAVLLESNVQSQNNVLQVLSYFIQKEQYLYVFHGYTTVALFKNYAGAFEHVMAGFDHLRNQAALTKKPYRVRIERARQGADLATVLRSFKMKEEMLNELSILNGIKLEERLQTGSMVKIVRE